MKCFRVRLEDCFNWLDLGKWRKTSSKKVLDIEKRLKLGLI
jgi:hypothetical protein